MLFALGIIVGIVFSILVIVTLLFFRRTIEHKTTIIEKRVDSVAPRPKGDIYIPDDEADEARAEIISKNSREGRDTPISELQ